MKELGITRGEWYWDGDPTNYDHKNEAPWLIAGGVPIITGEIEAKNKADVDLIVDAGNTSQKCGLLPSELLQQRDRCLMTLNNCRETIEMLQREIPGEQIVLRHEMTSRLRDIEAAIKNTETE